MADDESVEEIREKIRRLEAQWPSHTPSPTLLVQLDELEEKLALALREVSGSPHGAPVPKKD